MKIQNEPVKLAGRLAARLCVIVISTIAVAQTVSSVVVSPNSVPALVFSNGTVTLSAPAGVGGVVVVLKSNKSFAASVPANVTVLAGATTATFQVTTHPVGGPINATISATYKASSQTAALTVRVPLMGNAAGGYLGDVQLATHACFDYPLYGGFDSKGNLFISDSSGDRIRRIAPNGKIYTAAGVGQLGYNGEGIPANTTAMGFPKGVAVNAAGDFWYADYGNNRVRKVAVATALVNTVAGNGTRGYTGDNGAGTAAEISQPDGLALDAAGNLYFSDSGNNVVRVVNGSTGVITTVVGNGIAGFSGDGGAATSASLNNPRGIAFDAATGNLYVVDSLNYRIRVVTGLGTGTVLINTFAGNGSPATSGDGGLAVAASIGVPRGVLVSNNIVYLSQAGISRVRQVSIATGIIDVVAGSINGYDGEGNPPASAQFQTPTGLMMNASGNLLIVDALNNRVRKINSTAAVHEMIAGTTVNTIAGGFTGDGGAPNSGCLNSPESISMDASGNYLIGESGRVRKVTGGATISTVVGTGAFGYTGDSGLATVATMTIPLGVTQDGSGNVFIADNWNKVIRRVDNATQTITTLSADPTALDLTMLATDALGNVYSVDRGACVVRQVTPGGVSTVVAGVLGSCGYNSDGIAATTAQLNAPYGVVLDPTGNIYISDAGNNRVRLVTISSGLISTVAGTGVCNFSGDGGLATAATICQPSGLALDPVGRLLIADYQNFRVRLVENGKISTYAGTGIPGYNNNGRTAIKTNLGGPVAVALSPSNILYVVDDVNYRIRVIQ